jgi:hypothetical protein
MLALLRRYWQHRWWRGAIDARPGDCDHAMTEGELVVVAIERSRSLSLVERDVRVAVGVFGHLRSHGAELEYFQLEPGNHTFGAQDAATNRHHRIIGRGVAACLEKAVNSGQNPAGSTSDGPEIAVLNGSDSPDAQRTNRKRERSAPRRRASARRALGRRVPQQTWRSSVAHR